MRLRQTRARRHRSETGSSRE
ncbi:hypothetical protein STIAU_7435, partial [Stigmatella aurantiaca DW4/3-1]